MHVIPTVLFLLVLAAFPGAQSGSANWTATPFNPPSFPLAVRSPYFSVWHPQGNDAPTIAAQYPQTWFYSANYGFANIGWYASVIVDGRAYQIIGTSDVPFAPLATQTSVEFTPTSSIFTLTAGNMLINATFMSPIEPTDLVRQSLPFSYFYMTATSLDGNPHSVSMYSDVTGELITGDRSQIVQWTADDSGDYVLLKMQLQEQQAFTENDNHAMDTTEYYSFKRINGTTVTWSISAQNTNRANLGQPLNNSADPPPRAVQDNFTVLGILVDWGNITETPEPAVWALGLARDPVVQYLLPTDATKQIRRPYFASALNDTDSAAKFFLDDFSRAQAAANSFDTQLRIAGAALSDNYANLLALSVRQVLGTLDITLANNADGTWDLTDTKVFMKNIDSVGSDNGVNTVDVLYTAFPAMLYLNPELGGYLLAPLLEYQDSDAYTQTYAARNIGQSYPNATADGINNAHDYQVEGMLPRLSVHLLLIESLETANMLIMTLAYSQTSGNGTFLAKHYTLLRGWADFLANNTLRPINQKSADFGIASGLSLNNQTNTALKGIIGIAAMAKIAEIAGVDDDRTQFNSTAASYIEQWVSDAVAADGSHINFFYDNTNSNGLIYNLYADKLLQLGLVPDTVYQILAKFHSNTVIQTEYGLPLNNQGPSVSTISSIMLAASALTNTTVRDLMIGQLRGYASAGHNHTPFTTVYSPEGGQAVSGRGAGMNSPSIGSMFSPLALNLAIKPITLPSNGSTIPSVSPSNPSPTNHKSNAGEIGGGVGGGLVILGMLGLGVFFWGRRRREKLHQQHEYSAVVVGYGERRSSRRFTSYTPSEPFSSGTSGIDATTGYSTSMGDLYSIIPQTSRSSMPPSDTGPTSVIAQVGYIPRGNNRLSLPHQRGGADGFDGALRVGNERALSSMDRSGGEGSNRDLPSREGTAPQQVMLAKQSLLNEELRSEMENLRRDLERMRRERERNALGEAPPSYSNPI
ncbi:hypothetical protein M0805_009016 [Coniferiporia weirii]|nr:hypothetical protein M0805_009016 [Coniferiporia weirii]